MPPQPPQTPAPPNAPGVLNLQLESGRTYPLEGQQIVVCCAGLTVRIGTTGAEPAILDAQQMSRHFTVLGATLELDNIVLMNGCGRARASTFSASR